MLSPSTFAARCLTSYFVTAGSLELLFLLGELLGAMEIDGWESQGAYRFAEFGCLVYCVRRSGSALVLMSLANALYRVDADKAPFSVEKVASTGLSANRLIVHDGSAYILNALSANLQRVDLGKGNESKNPLSVFPTGSNPTDLVITKEAEGDVAWVTLLGSHGVALVSLATGGVIQTIASPQRDAGVDNDVRIDKDAGAAEKDVGRDGADTQDPDAGQPIVGISNVEQVSYGEGAGFGQAAMPAVVQGGPRGSGSGGTDVLSLGSGGEIVLSFGSYDIVDGPGPDFIVFENPMSLGPYSSFAEPAVVGVSSTGLAPEDFGDFACDLDKSTGDPQNKAWSYPGCAGVRPVLANVDANNIAADDPEAAGGDAFDLADLAVSRGRYLRIKDAGLSKMGKESQGFDLDAVVLINYEKRP